MITADQLPPSILGAGTVPEAGRRKLMGLDGIRGIAVLSVMFSHFERFLPATSWLLPFKHVITFGWAGVDLFFVLSGFLITGILMETRTAVNYFRSFYIRRFLRIFPIYYGAIIAIFLAATFVPSLPNVPAADQRWLYFTYLCNWIPFWTHGWPPNVVGHFWSLAVEEQFYIVWPFCVLALSARNLARLAAGLCVLALIVRIAWVVHSGPSDALMLGTFTRMDSLLFGALAAMMFHRVANLAPPKGLGKIAAVTLAAVAIGIVVSTWGRTAEASFPFITTVGYTLMALGFAAIILKTALSDGLRGWEQRIFTARWLTRTGRYSYGMYVYHVPLLGACELVIWNRLPPAVSANPWVALAYIFFLTLLTYGVALVSFEVVERRVLDLKRHAEPAFRLDDPLVQAGEANS